MRARPQRRGRASQYMRAMRERRREGETPRCGANTITVAMVGKECEWRVPEWALRYIRAGKVVQRNTNIIRHNGGNKEARGKKKARE
eukprot:g13836.t1